MAVADDDIRSKITILSKASSAKTDTTKDILTIAQAPRKNWGLHERSGAADLLQFQKRFGSAPGNRLTSIDFRDALKEIINFEYEDDEHTNLFLKINSSGTGAIDWDEFISYLLLGFFVNDPDNQRETLTLPIVGMPRILKSHHRHPISRICFCPDVAKDRSTNCMEGMYITASRDGMINWWSLDMSLLRTAYSSCPELKVQTTWVTDIACMPDVNVLVTSSTERDLRFYDTTAKTFVLKLMISSWEYMICTMHYHFSKDVDEDNILLLGDIGGNVRVILFSPILRGPFQNKPGKAMVHIRYIELVKRRLPSMRLVEFKNIHTDWVRQVSFYTSLHCFVSCATSPNAMLFCDITASKTYNMFHISKGIQCFTFDEDEHALVTGGPDCTVRLWNPFVPSKPSLIFQGHHAGVVHLVLQNNAERIYSLARDRVIKVWDIPTQACLQTYLEIPAAIGALTPLSVVYNPGTREMIMASMKIGTVILDELLNKDHTDGFTHSKGVSVALYNPLFKIVITCGMDSIIISWDPLTGKRLTMVREAHTQLLHGEQIPVEITAATFDPSDQLLLTGARNGSLKVWNFNTGICTRNMSIEYMMEVTMVLWLPGRILAVGWHRHITEFEDSGTAAKGRNWESRHTDDILCAAARPPETIVTSSFSGEIIFWKLETGQPYRRYNCKDPTNRIKIYYSNRDVTMRAQYEMLGKKRLSAFKRISMIGEGQSLPNRRQSMNLMAKASARTVSIVKMPSSLVKLRSLAVHTMLFLQTRTYHADVAALMIALENGQIQFWSDHPAGGYKSSFSAIHSAGDYVICMTTDPENMYLITGTTFGYIKIWLIKNYQNTEKVHINMPKLRMQFPFLWKDRIEGRAKRSIRDQPNPLLVSSYRAHLRSVTSIAYISKLKYLLSASADYSVRIWTLKGEYLNTLGTFLPWSLIPRHPPDVKKVASFTTLKCWNSGYVSQYVPGKPPVEMYKDISDDERRRKSYGVQLKEPYLGKYFKLPSRPERQEEIILDETMATIPCYTHLRIAPPMPVIRPLTPELVKETRLKKGQVVKKKKGLQFQGSFL